jgi:hypothetical protein
MNVLTLISSILISIVFGKEIKKMFVQSTVDEQNVINFTLIDALLEGRIKCMNIIMVNALLETLTYDSSQDQLNALSHNIHKQSTCIWKKI